MKKIMLLVMTVLAVFCITNVSQVNAFEYNGHHYNRKIMSDLKDFKKEMNTLSGKKLTGKKYRVNAMEHRRVVILGSVQSMEYMCISKSEEFDVGLLKGMQKKTVKTYSVENTVSTSVSMTTGITNMISVGLNFGNFASVGASSEATTSQTINKTTVYSTIDITSTEDTWDCNFDNVFTDKGDIAVGQMALVVKFSIERYYTEENRWFVGWQKLGSTEKTPEEPVTYYAQTFYAFLYQKGFGNKLSGYTEYGTIDV